MDKDLFEYEMKKAGYKTAESRAEAMGISKSAYYIPSENPLTANAMFCLKSLKSTNL